MGGILLTANIALLKRITMMSTTPLLSLNDRIKIGMDGRTNGWLKDKLLEKGIELSDSQLSQRLSGKIGWTGEEAIACFEILNMEIKESA